MISFSWIRRAPVDSRAALCLKDVTVRIGPHLVLTSVSFEIAVGDIVLVTGPNGAGKSSLFHAITGLPPIRVTEGTIHLFGADIKELPPHERVRRGLGYLFQRNNVFEHLTVRQNLLLAYGKRVVAEGNLVAATGQLAGASLATPVRNLSNGQKQRLAWQMVTLRNPCVLLLDEPESGVSEPMPAIPEECTALISTHEPTRWTVEKE